MDAIKYLETRARMTKKCDSSICIDCPISSFNNNTGEDCEEFENEYPEKVVEIVEKWDKEHPVKTYLDVFREKFPKATFRETTKTPTSRRQCICRNDLFGIKRDCATDNCTKCWEEEYVEE